LGAKLLFIFFLYYALGGSGQSDQDCIEHHKTLSMLLMAEMGNKQLQHGVERTTQRRMQLFHFL